MRFKYFMRGLGVGILFCTLIMFAAYQTSPNRLFTDEEVMARAKELGMVEGDSDLDKLFQDDTNTENNPSETEEPQGTQPITDAGQNTGEASVEQNTDTEHTQEKTTEVSKSTEGQTTESSVSTEETSKKKKNTEEQTTESVKTTEERTTESPKTTEEKSTDTSKNTEEQTTEQEVITATITVSRGMDSSSVAALLEKKGIISNAHDFDSYLNKNGYSTRIRIGSYVVKSTDTYKELAKIITKSK